MRRAFETAVSAICYSFIRLRFGNLERAPGPRWNRTVRFVLDQHARMPDYARLPVLILTLMLNGSSYITRLRPLHRLDAKVRDKLLVRARRSAWGPFRDLVRFYEALSVFGFREQLNTAASGGAISTARVAPKNLAASQNAKPTSKPALIRPPVAQQRSEVVVIGSGPGGAITACLLAEAGREVTLVESGPYVPLGDCVKFNRSEMEHKYRNGGVTAALGQTKVNYVEAHCVGGGSEINSGLYNRPSEEVLEHWRKEYQLEAASLTEMLPFFASCERDVCVSDFPGELPEPSRRLRDGAEAMGWKSYEARRWFKYDPAHEGRPGVQMSMTKTFIPRALHAGCRIVPNFRARKLARAGSGWVIDAASSIGVGKPTHQTLHCDKLFICGGAIQTAALLLASGIKDKVGHSLRMHPTVKVIARFPKPIDRCDIAVPAHQVREFSPNLSFGCSISSPQYLSLAMLDHPDHLSEVNDGWSRLVTYYAMTRGGIGRVHKLPKYNDPLVTYELGDSGMRDLANGLAKLCELLFAAGAEELYPSVIGLGPLRGPDDLAKIPDHLPKRLTSLITVHLFSSCPMGENKLRCVTNSFGQVHGHANLYIADASLLCTAPGVNPQGSVMAFARRNAMRFLGRM